MAHVSLTPTPVSAPIHVAPVVPLADDAGPITAIDKIRRHACADAAYVHGGVLATLRAWANNTGVAYQGGPLGMTKRHATSKGGANKDAMTIGLRARRFSPANHNLADALAILHGALETHGGER